jgi:uncharacterized protein with GYD domain
MATFLALINYTDQGIRNMKESPGRLDAVKKAFQAAGGEVKAFYLAMGRYDAVCIADAPDDETAARLILQIAGAGAVRTETLRVFGEAEYRKIIGAMR